MLGVREKPCDSLITQINRLIHVEHQLLQGPGRQPTTEEIAAEMETTPRRVREIIKISREPTSLELPVGDSGYSRLGEVLEDAEAIEPFEAVSEIMRRAPAVSAGESGVGAATGSLQQILGEVACPIG